MRLLIAGSRTLSPSITDIDEAVWNLHAELGFDFGPRDLGWVDSVISGGARGVDAAGEIWAHARICGPDCARRLASQLRPLPRKLPICSAVQQYPVSQAEWNAFKGAAGPIRNGRMARACDAAVVIWDGESPGTRDTIAKLEELGRPRRVIRLGGR